MRNQDGSIRNVTLEEAKEQYRKFCSMDEQYERYQEDEQDYLADGLGLKLLDEFETLSAMVMNILEGRGNISKMIKLEDAVEYKYTDAIKIIEEVVKDESDGQ